VSELHCVPENNAVSQTDRPEGEARLAEILLSQHIVVQAQLQQAIELANTNGISLRNALTGLDFCLEDEINWAISRALEIPFVLLAYEMVDSELVSLFQSELLQEIRAVPIRDAEGGITIVMADPLDEAGFARIQSTHTDPLRLAVAPSGRVFSVLEQLQTTFQPLSMSSKRIEKGDTSGVVTVYGMIVEARKLGANRILIRPAGEGLEAIFRLERGWLVYRLWSTEQSLSILTRCRVMLGVVPSVGSNRETAHLCARVNGERILIEGEFYRDDTGCNVDLHIYPLITSPTLREFTALSDSQREGLLSLLTSRRPSGVVIVNSPDQRQRYRMVYGLLAMFQEREYDIVSIEERKYLESSHVRRFQLHSHSPEWDEIVHGESDIMAVTDAVFWQWRDLSAIAGQRLVILGVDFANSWLAFKSFHEVLESQTIVADRLRAIWSGRRVDLTCQVCGGKTVTYQAGGGEVKCSECDGFGHSSGTDLFEVFLPDADFREMETGERSVSDFQEEFERRMISPKIQTQLQEGILSGKIFSIVNEHG